MKIGAYEATGWIVNHTLIAYPVGATAVLALVLLVMIVFVGISINRQRTR